MRFQNLLSIVLIIAVAVLLGWASQRFSLTFDWTYANRNSLTPASQRVVDALDAGPIVFTAYAYPGAARDDIRQRIARYRRAADNVRLAFVDPAQRPDLLRELGVSEAGEVRVRYQGRSETLADLTEPSITRALQRLSVAEDQWIVFLTGHGERSVTDESPGGYPELAAALTAQGLKVRELSLTAPAAIPDNATALTIASPRSDLLPGEIEMLRDYVERGGNLLWLDDPGPRYGLSVLAADLGVDWLPGTIIYPDYRALGTGHPAIALVATYPQTPITEHINGLTVFPFAGGLAADPANDWQSTPILRAPSRSWLETGSLERGTLVFEPDTGDRAGPITIGLALSRPLPDRSSGGFERQRALVVADSDFLTNGHIDTLSNRQLGMALFQWLARRDAQIAVDVPAAPDAHLELAPGATRSIWWLFVVVLPFGLLTVGVSRWVLRRRR